MCTDYSERFANLPAQKLALLAPYLQPLSFAQQRLWFLDQVEPNSALYNVVPVAVHISSGKLNKKALAWSLNEIVRRHQVLRSAFPTIQGQPYQITLPASDVIISEIALTGISGNKQKDKMLQLISEEVQQPFKLDRSLLLRAKLLYLNNDESVLVITAHHIVFDAWSKKIFLKELAVLYEGYCNGEFSPLSQLPVQYTDFARWQRHWLQGNVLKNLTSYWKRQLGKSSPILQLPTDRPRPPIQTFRGARQFLEIPKPVTEALKTMSQREGITLFMLLLTAFKSLLYYYTGQEDISVGSPIGNRNRVEIEELIGLFINTLVLRTDLSGNPSFIELLCRVREVALGAYTHQDLPFEKLLEELALERNTSHSPLFQVMFQLQSSLLSNLQLPGLTLNSLEVETGMARFDLTLGMADIEQGLVGVLEYKIDLFEDSTITCILENFKIILHTIVIQPEIRLNELVETITKAERKQRLIKKIERKEAERHKLIKIQRTPIRSITKK